MCHISIPQQLYLSLALSLSLLHLFSVVRVITTDSESQFAIKEQEPEVERGRQIKERGRRVFVERKASRVNKECENREKSRFLAGRNVILGRNAFAAL